MFCIQCGTKNSDTSSFCIQCGAKLTEMPDNTADAPSTASAETADISAEAAVQLDPAPVLDEPAAPVSAPVELSAPENVPEERKLKKSADRLLCELLSRFYSELLYSRLAARQ